MNGSTRFPRLNVRTNTLVISAGLGIGVILCGLLLKRWYSRLPKVAARPLRASTTVTSRPSGSIDMMPNSDSNRELNRTPLPSSKPRRRMATSVSVPPSEAVLIGGYDACKDALTSLGKALNGLDLVRNRSENDRHRAELLSSVIDRMRILETDISRIVQDGGFEQFILEDGFSASAGMSGPVRSGTLSVLSDDSFMSAVEEFVVSLDDELSKDVHVKEEDMVLLKKGVQAAMNGEVLYRKERADFCQCEDETDFAAKVYCLRIALEEVCQDAHRRVWLSQAGRQLLGDLLKHSKQDPTNFFKAYDDMILFFEEEDNIVTAEEELKTRGVYALSFWDVVLDFILLDAFDDLKAPPSAIYSVTKNYFLSQSMKYSTISTVIWSMLRAKRQRLANPNGFIAHFYNISETVSPAITLGFLGTDGQVGELCHYFKEQITQFVMEIFSTRKVRYTTVSELADDVWTILQSRTEAVMTRLSSELLPS